MGVPDDAKDRAPRAAQETAEAERARRAGRTLARILALLAGLIAIAVVVRDYLRGNGFEATSLVVVVLGLLAVVAARERSGRT